MVRGCRVWVLTFEGFQDERFEFVEVIADHAIHSSRAGRVLLETIACNLQAAAERRGSDG